jgi:hypothetical protein
VRTVYAARRSRPTSHCWVSSLAALMS